MSSVLSLILTTTFVFGCIRMTTPILLAGLGGLITGKAGVFNIALEGIMEITALTGVLVSGYMLIWTGNSLLSLIVAFIVAMLFGIGTALMLGVFSIKLKANIILSGIAINLFAQGITVFVMYIVTGEKGMTSSLKSLAFPTINIPLIQDIPIIGEIISGHNMFTYVAFGGAFLVYYLMFKTPLGLRIRAVGENPNAAESVGIKVIKIKYIALTLSGMFASMGGMFMAMGYVETYSRLMISGRGFIAMSAMNLAKLHPLGTMLTSFIFGMADNISIYLQSINLPSELLQTVPYLTTLFALFIFSISASRKAAKLKAQR